MTVSTGGSSDQALAAASQVPGAAGTATPDLRRTTTEGFRLALICVIGAAIAFAFQLHRLPATIFAGEIVPSDNDAFYHARRILDTAADPRNFFQFDPHMHAPEGTMLAWPWGYDYMMAATVRVATRLGLASDPLTALVYIPPFAVILSIILVTLIGRYAGLRTVTTALLVGTVAISPLTQTIHGLACVDHHFAEYIFILGFLASALAWLRKPASLYLGGLTGLVLGLAPAVHTLLFALQIPMLLVLTLLWWRRVELSVAAVATFGLTLVFGTILVLLPSLPFQLGYFEHFYLSWYHLYVACCSVVFVGLLLRLPPRTSSVLVLVTVAVVLALPLVVQIGQAVTFFDKQGGVLQEVGEAKSVLRLFNDGYGGRGRIFGLYSGLIFLSPLLVLGCAIAIRRVQNPSVLLVCIYSVLAIPLLWSQFRFHYYGSIALALPTLIFIDRQWGKRSRFRWPYASLAVVFLLIQIPSVLHAVRSESVVGRDPYFILTRLAMPALAEACEEDPGIVLAKNNEGNFIRYYTDCSLIANNFLLTPQDLRAFYEVSTLFALSPEQLLESTTPVKYVLARARGSVALASDGSHYKMAEEEDARYISDRLTDALLWGDPSEVDPAFHLVAEIPAPGKDYPYARIWKISR